ncbi:MAG TPA: DNA adenine methylase [Thermoleophilia bacterium]|nr:DNA adenine methylase [Thermoleophilia bacterium]
MKAGRPVMRWHGGKWKLAPWIISHFPEHRVYVEPFGGAGSVLMRKPRSYAEVYNDLDGEAVNVFRVLRDPASAAELGRLMRLTPFSRKDFEAVVGKDDGAIERARMVIFRSFAGFGSASANFEYPTGFRSNSNRSGTTPAHVWAHYPDEIAAFVDRLQGVVIESRPAIEVMAQHDGLTTLHYVDPPYLHSTRRPRKRARKEYGAWEMSDEEHVELATVLHGLEGMVVLSGYRSELYDQLYMDWERDERKTFADGAAPRLECVWLSPGLVVPQRKLMVGT